MTDRDRKKMVVFEFSDEVNTFIRKMGTAPLTGPATTVLALEPCAQARLRSLGIPYENTLELLGRGGHEDAVYQCDRIVQCLGTHFSAADSLGLRTAYRNLFIFHARFFLNHILFLLIVLHRAVRRFNPDEIVCFRPKASGFDDVNLTENDRFTGRIADRICQNQKIRCVFMDLGAGRHPDTPGKGLLERAKEGVKVLNFHLFSFFYAAAASRYKCVLSILEAYNIPSLIQTFEAKYSRVFSVFLQSRNGAKDVGRVLAGSGFLTFFSLPSLGYSKQKKRFAARLEKNWQDMTQTALDNPDLFCVRGIDFFPLFESYVRARLIDRVVQVSSQTLRLDRIISRHPPALVLAHHALGLSYNLGQICHRRGVPAVLISHGSHMPSKDRFDRIEWDEHGRNLINTGYEYIAVQTPWAQKYVQEHRIRSKAIPTGPLIFAKKHKQGHKSGAALPSRIQGKKVVLQAGTPKDSRAMRFYVYETIDEYVYNINSLIRAIETIDNSHLIVRFRPLDGICLADFTGLLVKSDCYSIHPEGKFEDFLMISDLMVSYSSTTIEEALQNRVPVLQYDPQGKYCHIPSEPFEPDRHSEPASCYYVDCQEKLGPAIEQILFRQTEPVSEKEWGRHVFEPDEVVDLRVYFKDRFR